MQEEPSAGRVAGPPSRFGFTRAPADHPQASHCRCDAVAKRSRGPASLDSRNLQNLKTRTTMKHRWLAALSALAVTATFIGPAKAVDSGVTLIGFGLIPG